MSKFSGTVTVSTTQEAKTIPSQPAKSSAMADNNVATVSYFKYKIYSMLKTPRCIEHHKLIKLSVKTDDKAPAGFFRAEFSN